MQKSEKPKQNAFLWDDKAVMEEDFRQAGFGKVKIEEVTERFYVPDRASAKAMWVGMADSFPTNRWFLDQVEVNV